MKKEILAKVFNEWMRRYTEEPERFNSEWKSIKEFLRESEEGKEPSYGQNCARYLLQLLEELEAGS